MTFPSLRLEGAILSPELFARVEDLPGQRPADFGLPAGGVVKDEIARAWADAQDYWRIFQRKLDALPANASATTETRNLWIVPLLGLLGYQLERHERGLELQGKLYPISHRAANRAGLPVHIVSVREAAGLDRKPERAAGPRMSAHGLVQEYLNLADQTYGLVTNGRLLRLLRDSSRLVKLTYLEFDLDRIFTDGLYADFALLYRFLHASRLPASTEATAESLIERYHLDSIEAGARIRDGLSFAVEKTLQDLANGFLSHRCNDALRAAIASGQLTAPVYYQQVLRLIYRLLFLFVIEERDLVYPKDARTKRDLYYRHYSLQRLRGLSQNRYLFDSRHDDTWFATLACFALFESEGTGAKLGIAPLAGRLFHPEAIGPLREAHLNNATLLASFDELCSFEHPDTHQRVSVNYGALATEEFGSVYERLLELHPVFLTDGATPRFSFKQAAGNERKTTGSYYTPSSLVECLLDSALEPVVRARLAGKTGEAAEEAILSIRVCDPACGSGHFLIAAGNRLARHLAIQRSGAEEPSPADRRHALRDVIGHCLYGVDINPMSVELCKVTLWIEATEPGKPLSFLDHHIQCGNSLLGVTPRLLDGGLPDDAFKPIAGDDKAVCAEAKKRNREERRQIALFHGTDTAPWERLGALPAAMLEVDRIRDDTAAGLHAKEERYAALVRSSGYLHSRFLADAWCAAFVWKKTKDHPYPVTNDVLRKIERNPHDCAPWMREEIQRLREQYQFFHWHLAFPEVFPLPGKGEEPENQHAGWKGGFDVMLGNPPWEQAELEEIEWFAERCPAISVASNDAEKKTLIKQLQVEDPGLHKTFLAAKRDYAAFSHFASNSGGFPLCGRGRMNTSSLFTELCKDRANSRGTVGIVVPTGIATDDTTKEFFRDLLSSRRLISLLGFHNGKGLFPAVRPHQQFCLLTLGRNSEESVEFAFSLSEVADLQNVDIRFRMTKRDIDLVNPNTGTCPIFASKKLMDLTLRIYSQAPILFREGSSKSGSWEVSFKQGLFNMATDSHLFRTRQQLEADGWVESGRFFTKSGEQYDPVFDAKMAQRYNHRAAELDHSGHQFRKISKEQSTLDQLQNPSYAPRSLYFVPHEEVQAKLASWRSEWFLGFKDITGTTSIFLASFAVIPRLGVGHPYPLLFSTTSAKEHAMLLGILNSLITEFILRQKLQGLHLTFYYVKQLPVLGPEVFAEPCAWAGQPTTPLRDWLLPRVLELTYTAWDLEPFARDCGWSGPPFVWDEARRFQLRCELDAAYFHLYGLSREDAAYILDTFPIVRRKDEAAHGTYRTRDAILALYDQFANSQATGNAFVSTLDPPPGDVRACHPKRKVAILAYGSLRSDPGKIGKHIAFRIKTETHIPIEYGRLSKSRGGGPTLVPHEKGAKVEAELLILPDDMPVNRARDLLWRRERRKEETEETYSAGSGPNSVLVLESSDSPWAETVLYTDFNATGKVTLSADDLAKAAVESVVKAPEGKDGISYLASALEAGIKTPLTDAYRDAILRLTGADSLADARIVAKSCERPPQVSISASAEAKPSKKPHKQAPAVPAPDLELNLDLDLFGNVTPSTVDSVRIWSDNVFQLPTAPRHGALREDTYVRHWLHALFTLQPEGQTGLELFNAFRLLLTKESRKVVASSDDNDGEKWSRAFDQPVSLVAFFACLLSLAQNREIERYTLDGKHVLRRAAGWHESPSDWVRADAEITQRARRDKALKDQLLPFIEPTTQSAKFLQELESAFA